MLWFTIWFMVILKIPVLYLGYVIWWAVKDPPEAYAVASPEDLGGGGPGWHPRRRRFGPRSGPHGSAVRRPAGGRRARARARA